MQVRHWAHFHKREIQESTIQELRVAKQGEAVQVLVDLKNKGHVQGTKGRLLMVNMGLTPKGQMFSAKALIDSDVLGPASMRGFVRSN